MKKKKSVWFMMVAILMGFIPQILTAYSSIAQAIETQPDKIVDQSGLKVSSSVSSDGNSLNWKLQYEKDVASDGNDQALKFKVTADGEAIAFNEDASFATNDDQWFAEKDFSKQSQGSLSFTTVLNVSKVALEIQADATKTDEIQAVTINKNILTSAVEGPHALKLPAVATQKTTEVSATSQTTAEEASEATSSEINASPATVGASNLEYLSGISAFSSIFARSTSLTVKKEWNDNEASHDPVMVTLIRTVEGGVEESTGRTLILSEDKSWEGVFDNLEIPVDGQKFAYSVKEEMVSGYATNYGEIKTISDSAGGTGGEPSVDSHWVPSPDTKLQDGKTYVFRVKGTEHVLVHHKDDVDDKNLTRASVTVIPGENSPNDDILTNVPLSAPWTVNYKVQDKGPGFIFYNGHNGDHYIQGDTWLPKEKDAAVNAYTPSDGRIQNVDKEEYLCWQADENQYYLRKDEDDYSARLEKFDLYELGSSLDRYEITITNTPGEPQPETSTSLIVKKEWSDSDAHDSVVVRLMRTGSGGMEESTGRTITLSADNNWEGVFDNLEIPEDGQKFAYFVKEESVPGYTTSYSEVENVAGSYWVPSSSNALVEGKNYVFLVRGTNYVLDHTRGETMKRGTATIGLDGSLMDVPSTAVWTAGSNTILYHTLGSTIYYMAEDKMTPKISEATGKIYTEKGYLGDKTKGGEYHYWSLGDNKYGIDENKDDSISEIFGLYEMGGETSAYQVVITNEKDTPTSTTDLSVKKEWGDPEKDHAPVMITLMRIDPDGNTRSTGRTLTLSDDNNWEGVFDNLSIPAEGEKFPYFVEEEEIADYITSYGDIEIVSGTSWEKKSFGTELVEGNDYVFVVKDKPFVLNHTSGEALRRGDVTVGSDGSLMDVPSTAIWTAGKKSKGHIILYHTLGGKTYYMAEDKMTSKMSEATGKTYTSKGYLGDRTKGGEYLYWDKSLYGIDEDKDDSVSEIFNLYTMTSSSDSYKTVIKNIPVDPEPEEKSKIHKTIDYLGDGDINPHTALTGKDFYRLYLDIFGSIQPVLISDELSAYVAYHRDQSDLKVIRTDKNGTITTIWENGAPTASNVDAYGIPIVQQVLYEPSNAQYSTGKVTVMFDSECQLDDENSFSLSFNVKITDYAKEQAVEKGYNAVGDADTDYGNNQTSSEMPGFRSNNSAYTTYISQDMGYRIEYLHPVIQTGGAKLQIDKVNTTGDISLPNAVFNLYRNANKNDEGAILIPTLSNIFGIKINPDPIVTDSKGSTTPITLAPGRYYLIETEAPAGYRILNKPIAFDISADGMVVLVIEESFADLTRIQEIEGSDILSLVVYNIENEFTKRPLLVEKYNKDSGKTLDGAKFTLKQYDDKWTNDGKVVGDDLIGNDAKSFASLAPGYYSLEETKVPTGYKKDDTVFKFQIDSAGKLLDENGKEITANSKPTTDGFYLTSDNKIVLIKYNELRDFDFSILKKNSQSNKPLADTEFSLATKEDSNTILATLKTNDEGTGQFLDASGNHYGVRPGTYVIKETKAPEGFVLLEGTFEVTINADGTVGDVTYDGKDLDKDAIKVNLKDEDNNVIELTVANTPKGQLPATGGSGIQTFIIVALALVTAAGALTICYFYRNRKELN